LDHDEKTCIDKTLRFTHKPFTAAVQLMMISSCEVKQKKDCYIRERIMWCMNSCCRSRAECLLRIVKIDALCNTVTSCLHSAVDRPLFMLHCPKLRLHNCINMTRLQARTRVFTAHASNKGPFCCAFWNTCGECLGSNWNLSNFRIAATCQIFGTQKLATQLQQSHLKEVETSKNILPKLPLQQSHVINLLFTWP